MQNRYFTAGTRTTSYITRCLLLFGGAIGAAAWPSPTVFAQIARSVPDADILITGRRLSRNPMQSVVIDKVVNIIGIEGTKEDVSGRLIITEKSIVFLTDKTIGNISIASIKLISMEHTSKPLLRGIAGTLAGFAPNGGGQIYGVIRPGAEILSLFYEDNDHALHGALILIPKSSKMAVTEAFEQVGISFDEPMTLQRRPVRSAMKSRQMTNRLISSDSRPAVTIMLPDSESVPVPTAFTASAYEQLVAQTTKSGMFGAVWREGDRRADASALTMTVRITDFKKGNAGVRGAIPVVGMIAGKTLITANVNLADAAGTVLLDKEVEGSKRMMGESIAATKSLAQRVTGSLKKVPGFVKGPPTETRYASDKLAAR